MPIRVPSTFGQLYAWHRAALLDARHPRHEGQPECGWFKTREVRNGPWVPAKIWCESKINAHNELEGDETLKCSINGIECDPAKNWTFLKPITRQDYDALFRMQTTSPAMAATTTRIDLTEEIMTP